MASRYEITGTVQQTGAASVRYVANASVQVKDLQGNNLTVYAAETGSSTLTNPLTADVAGRVDGWVEAPDFDLTMSGSGVTTYTQKVRQSPAGTFNVKSYGAKGNGSTDDATAEQAALTAAGTALGGKVVWPGAATYKTNTGLTVPTGVELFFEEGAVIDGSAIALNGVIFTYAGSIAAAKNITVAVVAGATSVTVAAGDETGFAAGDLVKIKSTDVYDPGRTSSTVGELALVLSTASGSITFRSPLAGAYTTSPTIAKITPTTCKIQGAGRILGSQSQQHIGIKCTYGRRVRIGNGLELKDVGNVGIQLLDCWDFDISEMDIEGTVTPQGYGVSVVDACMHGRVHHNNLRNCRHWTSVNNTSAGGLARFVAFEDNHCRDSTSDGMDCHSAAEYISWERNYIYDPDGVGINVEINKATIKDNKIFRPRTTDGILALPCAAASLEYRITGNEVYDAPQYGIRMVGLEGAGATDALVMDVMDNLLVRCAFAAVYIDPSIQVTSPFRVNGARVSRNLARACSASGSVATFYLRAADGGEMCNNTALEQPNGIGGSRVFDMTRGKYTGNVTHFTSAGTTRGHRGFSMVDCEVGHNITYRGSGAGGVGLELDSNCSGCRVHGNEATGSTTPYTIAGTAHYIYGNRPGVPTPSVASAGTITLPGAEGDVYKITGSNAILSIDATGMAGRTVKLVFTAGATLTDGSNLKLPANFVATGDDGYTLACDGTNWYALSAGAVN